MSRAWKDLYMGCRKADFFLLLSHEPLEVPAPQGQWVYFDMAEEAAANEQ